MNFYGLQMLLLTSIASLPSPQERDCGMGHKYVSMSAEEGSVKKAAAITADRPANFITVMKFGKRRGNEGRTSSLLFGEI